MKVFLSQVVFFRIERIRVLPGRPGLPGSPAQKNIHKAPAEIIYLRREGARRALANSRVKPCKVRYQDQDE